MTQSLIKDFCRASYNENLPTYFLSEIHSKDTQGKSVSIRFHFNTFGWSDPIVEAWRATMAGPIWRAPPFSCRAVAQIYLLYKSIQPAIYWANNTDIRGKMYSRSLVSLSLVHIIGRDLSRDFNSRYALSYRTPCAKDLQGHVQYLELIVCTRRCNPQKLHKLRLSDASDDV